MAEVRVSSEVERRHDSVSFCPVQFAFCTNWSYQGWPRDMSPTGIGAPDCINAPWNRSPAFPSYASICKLAEMAPADSPQRIMRELFPPKELMYFLTQPRAARSAR